MADQILIPMKERELGRKNLKEWRSKNFIPVVVYGKGQKNQYGAIEHIIFKKFILTQKNALFTLKCGAKKKIVLMRQLDQDTLNNKITHADFYEVNLDIKVDATVNFKFVGEAPGVKSGGVLNKPLESLHVSCLPSDIPSEIEVDISGLNIEDKVCVSDLNIPSNVKVLHEQNQIIASATSQRGAPEPVSEKVSSTDSSEKAPSQSKESNKKVS